MSSWNRHKRLVAIIGVAGIVVEVVAVVLLATKRISPSVGTPIVIAAMLVAFVPLFTLSRSARRR